MTQAVGRAYIGTSGWSYPEWRTGFYKGVAQKNWLPHCAQTFDALEVNATFYRQMRDVAYERWHRDTPDGFRFVLKGHRYVTHVKRLKDVGAAVARQRAQAEPLAAKLAAVLWQFPANFHADLQRLDGFLDLLAAWPGVRHALEFRDTSWFTPEAAERLGAINAAAVLSDAPDWPMWDDAAQMVASDFVYLRLHGHKETYVTPYGKRGLKPWAGRIKAWLADGRDVLCFFDNTMTDAAARDAQLLREMLDR